MLCMILPKYLTAYHVCNLETSSTVFRFYERLSTQTKKHFYIVYFLTHDQYLSYKTPCLQLDLNMPGGSSHKQMKHGVVTFVTNSIIKIDNFHVQHETNLYILANRVDV